MEHKLVELGAREGVYAQAWVRFAAAALSAMNVQNRPFGFSAEDPKEIYARLSDKYDRLLFQIDEQSQFYIGFAVWAKLDETN